jgi:hypothetical protein
MPPASAPPSLYPLAELTLSAQPAWREYYADRKSVLALEKPPSVTVESGIRAGFDHQADTLARGYDSDRALVGGWYAEAWKRTFESAAAWPVAVPVAEPEPPAVTARRELAQAWDEQHPDDAAHAAQSDAQALLARWAPDVSLPGGEATEAGHGGDTPACGNFSPAGGFRCVRPAGHDGLHADASENGTATWAHHGHDLRIAEPAFTEVTEGKEPCDGGCASVLGSGPCDCGPEAPDDDPAPDEAAQPDATAVIPAATAETERLERVTDKGELT